MMMSLGGKRRPVELHPSEQLRVAPLGASTRAVGVAVRRLAANTHG